ncbi:MAG: hypothetical protein COA78_06515 [Blastopirellula sp.]|nr:MAG: hypothetical protein COA78_06515 [Blastopirellula sp.]
MNRLFKIISNICTFRIDKFYRKITGQSQILFSWKENAFFRVELKEDVIVRLLITLTAWAFGIGVMGIIISQNANPVNDSAGLGISVGLGFVLFGGPVALFLFFRGKFATGNVTIQDDQIERRIIQYWGGMLGTWVFTETWPYQVINRCRIIPAKSTGKRFSLMIIECYGGVDDLTAIPKHIDPQDLVTFLQSKGVNVEQDTSIPTEHREGISWFVPLGAGLFAIPFLLVGLSMISEKLDRLNPEVAKEEKPVPRVEINNLEPAKIDKLKARAPDPIRVPRDEKFVQNEKILPKVIPNEQEEKLSTSNPKPKADISPNPEKDSKSITTSTPPPTSDRKDSLPKYTPPTYTPPSVDEPDPSLPQYTPPTYQPPKNTSSDTSQPASTITTNRTRPVSGLTKPDRSAPRPAGTPGVDSEMQGGSGGFGTDWIVDKNLRPVIGIRYSQGSWGATKTLAELEPIFDRSAKPKGGRTQTVLARDGYALGGINVNATKYVHAVRLLFLKIKPDGSLDPDNRDITDWLGIPESSDTQSILGNGKPVIGFKVRKGAILDSVGLVFAK